MNRSISPAVIVFCVASCCAFAAGAASTYVAAATELAIDGVACGKVYSAEGGDPRATVVVSNPGGNALPKKQISGVSYAPITVEIAFPPAQPILDWIGDLCANRQTRKTLLLTTYNASGQRVGNALQATDTRLTEVRFPAFDTSSKDAARLTLVFTPAYTQATPAAATSSPVTQSAGAATKAATLANFKVQIGNLPANRVSRIEAITIKQPVTENIVGSTKQTVQIVGTTEFSNLVLTISSLDIADWNTWRDSFVVTGKNDDGSEMSGSLDLLAADMTTKLMTLQFSHVGILRASPVKEVGSDSLAKFQAELYCESMAPGTAPTKSALTPITTMVPASAKLATVMPAAATTPAGSAAGGTASGGAGKADTSAGGGAADPRGESSTTASSSASSTKGGETSPSGGADPRAAETATLGSAAASSGKSDPANEAAAAQARASSGESSAPTAAAGSATSGAGAKAGDGAAGAAGANPASTTTPVPAVIDQGARDPKDFPRPEGSVRKSYSSIRQKTYSQEIATYSSKSTPDALEEFYTKSLTAAGWELGTRVENNGSIANTHQIVLNWRNGLRSVMITLAEVKAGGAEIGVNLTTKFAP
jgi:hypothetical protein